MAFYGLNDVYEESFVFERRTIPRAHVQQITTSKARRFHQPEPLVAMSSRDWNNIDRSRPTYFFEDEDVNLFNDRDRRQPVAPARSAQLPDPIADSDTSNDDDQPPLEPLYAQRSMSPYRPLFLTPSKHVMKLQAQKNKKNARRRKNYNTAINFVKAGPSKFQKDKQRDFQSLMKSEITFTPYSEDSEEHEPKFPSLMDEMSACDLRDADIRSEQLIKNAENMKLLKLKPIQNELIKIITSGTNSFVVNAPPGSGKTVASIIGVVELLLNKKSGKQPVPTKARYPKVIFFCRNQLSGREVVKLMYGLCVDTDILYRTAMGMMNTLTDELDAFNEGCDILISTGGRFLEFSQKAPEDFMSNMPLLIFDDGDCFCEDELWRTKLFPAFGKLSCRRLLLSSTCSLSKNEIKLSMKTFETLYFGTVFTALDIVEQEFVKYDNSQLVPLVIDTIMQRSKIGADGERILPKTLIFISGVNQVRMFSDMLNGCVDKPPELRSTFIFSKQDSRSQQAALYTFRDAPPPESTPVMIATDIMATGVPMSQVSLVIHIGMPSDVKTYVRRIGRAVRDGKHGGTSVFFLNPAQFTKEAAIYNPRLDEQIETLKHISNLVACHALADEGGNLPGFISSILEYNE